MKKEKKKETGGEQKGDAWRGKKRGRAEPKREGGKQKGKERFGENKSGGVLDRGEILGKTFLVKVHQQGINLVKRPLPLPTEIQVSRPGKPRI